MTLKYMYIIIALWLALIPGGQLPTKHTPCSSFSRVLTPTELFWLSDIYPLTTIQLIRTSPNRLCQNDASIETPYNIPMNMYSVMTFHINNMPTTAPLFPPFIFLRSPRTPYYHLGPYKVLQFCQKERKRPHITGKLQNLSETSWFAGVFCLVWCCSKASQH